MQNRLNGLKKILYVSKLNLFKNIEIFLEIIFFYENNLVRFFYKISKFLII